MRFAAEAAFAADADKQLTVPFLRSAIQFTLTEGVFDVVYLMPEQVVQDDLDDVKAGDRKSVV